MNQILKKISGSGLGSRSGLETGFGSESGTDLRLRFGIRNRIKVQV